MPALNELHVLVKFGTGISADAQSRSMMRLEEYLRKSTGQNIEVFKETMDDDSKLRRFMTPEERAKL